MYALKAQVTYEDPVERFKNGVLQQVVTALTLNDSLNTENAQRLKRSYEIGINIFCARYPGIVNQNLGEIKTKGLEADWTQVSELT